MSEVWLEGVGVFGGENLFWVSVNHKGFNMDDWKVTCVSVRTGGEWGTFFVRESPVVKRDDGKGYNAQAEWTANTSFGVFGHYWSSMGQPFGEFISDIASDYLLRKVGRKVTDSEMVAKELQRLVCQYRKERRIEKDIAVDAIDEIKRLMQEYEGDSFCVHAYESIELSRVPFDWCDISTKSYETGSLMFAKKLWPAFVKQFNEQTNQVGV